MILAALAASVIAHSALAGRDVTDKTQAHLVQLYSEGKCDHVQRIARRIDVMKLRPNVMAIAASCGAPGHDPEALFEKAEALSPTGDLIVYLHAKYRWKRNPKSADPLWQRLLMIARNDYFRDAARDHLAGVISPSDGDKPINLSPSTGFAQIVLAAEHRTNAQPSEFVFLPAAESFGYLAGGDLTFRRWYRFGSLAAHFNLSYERPLSAIQYTLWGNNLEVPVAIHITTNKDLIVRPFTGYSRIGASPYRFHYGVGMSGAVYQDEYTQSVQGIVYADRILVPALSAYQGAHYRFEYQWDFYPRYWFISSVISVEHVSSTPTSQLFGFAGQFQTSHTDVGVDLKFEREFSRFTVGIDPRATFRVSSQESTFFSPSLGQLINKQRQDWDVAVQVNGSLPLLPSLQLYAWFEWRRLMSNLGPADYLNANYSDRTVGLGVKSSLSTY